MKYISEKGTIIEIHKPAILRRTLSFRLNNPKTFDPNKMIKMISEEGGPNIKELRFMNRFRHPDNSISHAYDVIFEIPYCEIEGSRMRVNLTMVKIEDRLEKEANINYNGKRQGRHRRDWMES